MHTTSGKAIAAVREMRCVEFAQVVAKLFLRLGYCVWMNLRYTDVNGSGVPGRRYRPR